VISQYLLALFTHFLLLLPTFYSLWIFIQTNDCFLLFICTGVEKVRIHSLESKGKILRFHEWSMCVCISVLSNYRSCSFEGCSKVLTDPSGIITSPNYGPKNTLETSHANGQSRLKLGNKSTCILKILSSRKVEVVEQIIYYCTTVILLKPDWLDDIVQHVPTHSLHLPILFTWNFILTYHSHIEDSLQFTTPQYQQQVLVYSIFCENMVIR
jgi:hypothetical protein